MGRDRSGIAPRSCVGARRRCDRAGVASRTRHAPGLAEQPADRARAAGLAERPADGARACAGLACGAMRCGAVVNRPRTNRRLACAVQERGVLANPESAYAVPERAAIASWAMPSREMAYAVPERAAITSWAMRSRTMANRAMALAFWRTEPAVRPRRVPARQSAVQPVVRQTAHRPSPDGVGTRNRRWHF